MPSASFAVPAFLASGEEIEVRDGMRAVEVSAMFEDAVLDVRLFDNPQAGRISGATKILLGLGTASLLTTLIMLIVAFVQVGEIRRARDAWLDSGKAYHEFRVPRDNPALDIVSFSTLLFGIAALMWGMFRLFEERGDRDYTIGTDPNASFPVPDVLPVNRLPLLRSTGTDFEVIFTPQMSGDLSTGTGPTARSQSLKELVQGGAA